MLPRLSSRQALSSSTHLARRAAAALTHHGARRPRRLAWCNRSTLSQSTTFLRSRPARYFSGFSNRGRAGHEGKKQYWDTGRSSQSAWPQLRIGTGREGVVKIPSHLVLLGVFSLALLYQTTNRNPYTGRIQFSFVPDFMLNSLAQRQANAFRDQRVLPQTSREAQLVKRTLQRLLDANELGDAASWNVTVLKDDTVNAFALPDGSIFVFTGLLDLANGNEGEVASTMSHEIAHVLCQHIAEKMSVSLVVGYILLALGLPYELGGLFVSLPMSRSAENEADRVGMGLMVNACYDPHDMIRDFEKLQKKLGKESRFMKFTRTHPLTADRIDTLKRHLAKSDYELRYRERCVDEVRLRSLRSAFHDDFEATLLAEDRRNRRVQPGEQLEL